MRTIRIACTGGGTGGHIYPLVAVMARIQELAAPTGHDLDIRYFGNPGTFRGELEAHDIRVVRIVSSKLRRYFDVQNFFDIFRFAWSIAQGLWKLYWFMPDVVFSKGGPGALAITLVSRFYRIPLVVHESDTVPGITNQISATSARFVLLGFEAARDFVRTRGDVKTVGNPIRRGLRSEDSPETEKTFLGFDPAEPLVLVLGGSQGAERLNGFILENLALLVGHFQLLHQVGPKHYQSYRNEYAFLAKTFPPGTEKRYRFAPYFNESELRHAFGAADLLVSRAGASTLFEIAAAGVPAILIPLQSAANNHQRENAFAYAKTGAAIVLTEENLLGTLFLEAVESILKTPEKSAGMARAARAFARPDADQAIAAAILEAAGSAPGTIS